MSTEQHTSQDGARPVRTATRAPACPDQGAVDRRFHGMDAVRAFALLLGLFFHGAQSFVPYVSPEQWPVKDGSSSALLGIFFFISHIFRMAIFYLIAGFFARLLLERRGVAAFVRQRAQRILGPLLVGWLVLYPVVFYLWFWGGTVGGRAPLPRATSVLQRTLRGFADLEFLRERFHTLHLWFLYYLLMLYGVALLMRWGWPRLVDPRGPTQHRIDAVIEPMLSARWACFALAVPTAVLLLQMRGWVGVDTPSTTMVPDLAVLGVYLLFFGAGWLLHRRQDLLVVIARRWPWHLAAGFLLTWFFQAFHGLGLHALATELWWLRVLHMAVYALVMWLWTFGWLGLFHQLCTRPSRRWRYLADSSYWLYLVHLPVVMILQITVADWAWPWPAKYGLVMLVTLPLLLLTYDLLVRPSWLGRMLNGARRPRACRLRSS